MDANKNNFKLEDFKQIREQIRFEAKSITQVFIAAIIGSISLLSGIGVYLFRTDFAVLFSYSLIFFLFPPIIAIFSLFILSSHRKDIHRMGTYLQVFIEENGLGAGWETNVDNFRKECNQLLKGETFDYIPLAFWVIQLSSLLLAIIYMITNIKDYNLVPQIAIVLALIFSFLIEGIYLRKAHNQFACSSAKIRDKFYEEWKKIKDKRKDNCIP